MARLILDNGIWQVVDDIEEQTIGFAGPTSSFGVSQPGSPPSNGAIHGKMTMRNAARPSPSTGSFSGYSSGLTGSLYDGTEGLGNIIVFGTLVEGPN